MTTKRRHGVDQPSRRIKGQEIVSVYQRLRSRFLFTNGCGRDSWLPTATVEIYVYQRLRSRFMFTNGYGRDSCLPTTTVEIPVYQRLRSRFMFTNGYGRDSWLPTATVEIQVYYREPCVLRLDGRGVRLVCLQSGLASKVQVT